MLHVGFRAMHESMTSQKIKKLGAGGAKLGGGPKLLVGGGHGPPAPPLATGLVDLLKTFPPFGRFACRI